MDHQLENSAIQLPWSHVRFYRLKPVLCITFRTNWKPMQGPSPHYNLLMGTNQPKTGLLEFLNLAIVYLCSDEGMSHCCNVFLLQLGPSLANGAIALNPRRSLKTCFFGEYRKTNEIRCFLNQMQIAV